MCAGAGVCPSYTLQLLAHSTRSSMRKRVILILFIQFHFRYFRISRICLLLLVTFFWESRKRNYCLNTEPCCVLRYATANSICLIGIASSICRNAWLTLCCLENTLFPKKCLHSFTFFVYLPFCFIFFQFFFIRHTAYTHCCMLVFISLHKINPKWEWKHGSEECVETKAYVRSIVRIVCTTHVRYLL